MLIGAYAVGYHGYPRATNDMDIFVSREIENAEKLVNALRDFGFATNELSTGIFTQEKSLVRMGVPPMKIEITNFIDGVEFEEAFAERVVGEIDEIEVSLIGLRLLKINKKASGRFKDLNDLENLP